MVAAAAALLCLLLRRAGPIDRPRARGAHAAPTPTSGGLALIAAVGLGVALAPHGALGPPPEAARLGAAFALAALLGLMGGLDDLLDLSPRLKLAVQSLLAVGFACVARVESIPLGPFGALALGPVVGGAGSAFFIVLVVNAVNFMDGSDGLAAGGMALMFLALAGLLAVRGDGPAASLALFAGAANLGFLPFNFPRAQLFQGDAGSLFSGFLLAALAVAAAGPKGLGPVPLVVAPTLLLPFLADVLFTLLRRARAGRPLLKAHAEHLYQRWRARRGGDHVALAGRMLLLLGLSAALAAALAALAGAAPPADLAGFLIAVLAAGAFWRRCSRAVDEEA
jgi:UDP-N-acetylmuramyl pentapeptide phosphotransferase/UDP-N-acetylglucosamine-1-phosphate transferase